MEKSIFPESMLNKTAPEMTLESIAGKMLYFQEELHLLHWQSTSYSEHKALGKAYTYIEDFKDGLMEKLMGYMNGKRPAPYKMDPLINTSAMSVVSDLMTFALNLKTFAENNNYLDISNLADELSGECAKTKYLLTLS